MTHVLARLDKGKRRRPKVSTYTLPAEKLAQREAAFIIYRDMGTGRSIVAVERKLKQDHPEIAVSRPTLEKWSRQHDWAERVRQHDAAARAALQRAGQHGELSADFDQVDKLTRAGALGA